MNRPWVRIAAASAALLAIIVVTRYLRGQPSATEGLNEHVERSTQNPIVGAPESGVGWIAKPGAGAGSSGGRGAAPGSASATQRGSTGVGPGASLGGGATVAKGGSRGGNVIGGGHKRAPEDAEPIGAQRSLAGVPGVERSGPLTGGGRQSASQQGQVARDGSTQSQAPSASDPAEGDAGGQQDPVLSISFDQSTVPEKGEGPVVEHDIAFDGQGATFSTDSQFAIPDAANLTGDAGTISFCVRPQWAGDEQIDASLVSLRAQNQFNNRLQIAKNGQFLRFLTADNTGHEAGAGVNISGWQPGQGHLVTATWGEALTSLYVDGKLVGSQTYEGQIEIPQGTPMYIGSDIPGGAPGAQGSLADFQVYNRSLLPGEVTNLVANCQ